MVKPKSRLVVTDEYDNTFTYVNERTCFNASTRKDEMQFTCSECCLPVFISLVNDLKVFPNYCPHCGAKVVKE